MELHAEVVNATSLMKKNISQVVFPTSGIFEPPDRTFDEDVPSDEINYMLSSTIMKLPTEESDEIVEADSTNVTTPNQPKDTVKIKKISESIIIQFYDQKTNEPIVVTGLKEPVEFTFKNIEKVENETILE